MRRLFAKIAGILVLATFLQTVVFAAAAKSDTTVVVADSRKFSGWEAWWANLYNESHFWFALITVLILPLAALLLGQLTSAWVARLGINLRSRELSER